MDLLTGYKDMSTAAHTMMLVIMAVLVVASLLISISDRRQKTTETHKLVSIIKSWWVMIALIFTSLACGQTAFLVFIGVVSFIALREFVSVLPLSPREKKFYPLLYLLVPLYFLQIGSAHLDETLSVAPTVLFYVVSTVFLMAGNIGGYMRSVSLCAMGFFLTIFNLSHIGLLLYLPQSDAGLVLYLLFLVQFNDVAQWFWGRFFGKTKIVPRISPNKTVAGLVGGVVTTTLLSVAIAPYLIHMSVANALLTGCVLSLLGFLGDITLSAIKRDSNIKDFSNLIPGHGGVLDRVDSLVFSAPAFYYLMRFI